MISTDISISAKVEEGDDFDVALFDRMIAHQDDWGRLVGEPEKVKSRLRPLSKKAPERFEKAIRVYARNGLICWYQVNGARYIALKTDSCSDYQAGIHAKAVERKRHSQYPPPPLAAFRWPEDGPVPSNPRIAGDILDGPREVNTREHKRTYGQDFAAEKASAAASCPWCRWRSDHDGEVIPDGKRFRWQRYHDAYADRIRHCLVITGRERRLLKNACEKYGEEPVLSWWIDWLSSPSAIGHSLAVFCSNAVLTRFAELEAKRNQDPQDWRP